MAAFQQHSVQQTGVHLHSFYVLLMLFVEAAFPFLYLFSWGDIGNASS